MRKNELYLENGFADMHRIIDTPAPFVVCLGGRGTGKTFGALRDMLQRKEPFVLVRRTQTQVDIISKPDFNPFRAINAAEHTNIITSPISKYTSGFYNSNDEGQTTGVALGYIMALSTFSNIRGFSVPLNYIIFDEFIPERSEKRIIRHEGEAFLNMYESLNRNRELNGEPPLKCILLANTNDLNSPILTALGVTMLCDRMNRKQMHYATTSNGLVAIVRLQDSPVSQRKAATVLYQVAATGDNEDFAAMAISNKFSRANYEHVGTRPLKEYRPLCTIGAITASEHKSRDEYYITRAGGGGESFDTTPLEIRRFRAQYGWLWLAAIDGRVTYADYLAKQQFEQIFC